MRTALDSNILSSLWSNEPGAPSIARRLQKVREGGSLVLSPIAYTEVFAYPRATEDFVHHFLESAAITVDFHLNASVWLEAGRRFSQYADRRRHSGGGHARRLPADFVVGAHALLQADRLMTLDLNRYERDFPDLRLLTVEELMTVEE